MDSCDTFGGQTKGHPPEPRGTLFLGVVTGYCQACGESIDAAATACPACGATAPPTGFPEDARIGQLVAGGQYRVVRRLGAGGFGVVYEVETMVGGLRRALKVLSSRWARDAEIRERFVNEALVLEQVSHPNIARCFAAGRLDPDGDLYLLFELIDGAQLARLLRNNGPRGSGVPLAPMRAARLARQVAAGLRAAHEAGVLHRDLKPENILITRPGTSREQARVVDFGIAKVTEHGSASTQTIVGTPDFMAPEQFVPGTALDARVDLWQLGAVLFTMLTGRPPYAQAGGQVGGILAAQAKHSDFGPSPGDLVAEVATWPQLEQLVRRLLATRVDARPDSAADVCEELARIEHGQPAGARHRRAHTLLGALCATPSDSGWIALHGYIDGQGDERESLVVAANRLLESWPDHHRRAPNGLWEAVRRAEHAPLWPLVRTLDLSARGLSDGDLRRLADTPALAGITRLDLSHNNIGNEGLQALLTSPHLGALTHLDLSFNRLSSQGLSSFHSTRTPALVTLRLAHNGIGARGVRSLTEAALCLRDLDLSGNDLGADGASALASADSFSELRALRLADARIGAEGLAALCWSPHLQRLEELELHHNQIGAAGAATLALSENAHSLRRLGLASNELGRPGMQLILGSGNLGSLECLDLSSNDLGASAAMQLAGSPFVKRLSRLAIADNDLGDAGIAALLGSIHLSGLRELSIAQNRITAAGASLLVNASPQLECLDLSHNPLGDDGAAAVAEALPALRVDHLWVSGCGLGGKAVAAVIDGGRLCSLHADRNPLAAAGAAAIADARGLSGIRELTLSHAQLGADGVEALSASPHLRALNRLDLSSNGLADEGVTPLVANATQLAGLEVFDLAHNDLGPSAAEALAASPLARHLKELRLSHNYLGDAGAELLARGAGWHALRRLDLRHNGIGLAGAAALTSSVCLAMVHHFDLAENALVSATDVYTLRSETLALMESSFARIATKGADFAERFYTELFARYPGVKPLFAKTNMQKQQRHLLNSLVLVIDNLRTPEMLEQNLRALGKRHIDYGVAPTHYFAVTSTLVDCMSDVYDGEWTTELQKAWNDGLEAVAHVMMDSGSPATLPSIGAKQEIGHVEQATGPTMRHRRESAAPHEEPRGDSSANRPAAVTDDRPN